MEKETWVLKPQDLLCIQVWGPHALALDEKERMGTQAPRTDKYTSLGASGRGIG